jgi:ATP-dependent exoDNAse (exonuclease V) beta subunit
MKSEAKPELTPQQQTAVSFNGNKFNKNLIIEAGAGAGKTSVLTERIWQLVSKKTIQASEIVVATFSKGADAEIQERIEKRGQALEGMHVSTIDALFGQLVDSIYPLWFERASNSLLLPLRCHPPSTCPEIEIWSDAKAQENSEPKLAQFLLDIALEQRISKNPLDEGFFWDFLVAGGFKKDTSFATYDKKNSRSLLLAAMLSERFIAANSPEIITAQSKIHPAHSQFTQKLKQFAQECFLERLLRGTLTYNDRTLFLYHSLCVPSDALAGTIFDSFLNLPLLFHFKELIVDEYQDTNLLQHEILVKITELNQARMVVVGDPKQSIYGFRGAHVSVFQELCQNQNWAVVELLQNFRSHPDLLPKINFLSQIAFQFENLNLHENFCQSPFFKEAQLSRVKFKELMPKNKVVEEINDQYHMQNRDEFKNSVCDENQKHFPRFSLLVGKTFNFENGSSLVNEYYYEIYTYLCRWKQNFPLLNWNQVCLLCETNKTCEAIHSMLSQLELPSEVVSSKDKLNVQESSTMFNAKSIASALLEWMLAPVNAQKAYLVLSLKVFQPHFWLTEFLLEWKKLCKNLKTSETLSISQTKTLIIQSAQNEESGFAKHPTLLNHLIKIFEQLEICSNTAAQLPFESWQLARSSLNLSMLETSFFDDFAQGFFALRKEITLEDLKSWAASQNSETQASEYQNSQTQQGEKVQIMTIHASKGLEWHTVGVILNSKRSTPSSPFSIVPMQNSTLVKWMTEELQNYSLVPWVENSDFAAEATSLEEEKGKIKYFIDMQNSLQQLYERQRVLYTAFTRPIENLFIVGPTPASSATKKSFYAKFTEWQEKQLKPRTKKTTLDEEFTTLETFVMAAAMQTGNHILEPTEAEKTKIMHLLSEKNESCGFSIAPSSSSPKMTQSISPELQTGENSVCVVDSFPKHIWQLPNFNHLKFSEATQKATNFVEKKLTETHFKNSYNSLEIAVKGTHFHSFQELYGSSTVLKLKEASEFYHCEHEIWLKEDSQINRMVLDVFGCIDSNLLKSLASENWIQNFTPEFLLELQHSKTRFVLDFKTGGALPQHLEKMKTYLNAVRVSRANFHLEASSDSQSINPPSCGLVGIVVYSKQNLETAVSVTLSDLKKLN